MQLIHAAAEWPHLACRPLGLMHPAPIGIRSDPMVRDYKEKVAE